jgi:hypothetical protein
MKKISIDFIAFTVAAFSWSNGACQYYFYNDDYYESAIIWSAGFSAGGMNCLTDLGGKKGPGRKFIKDINWNTTRPCGSLFAGANFKEMVAARAELAFGQIKASDDILKNDNSSTNGRFIRNLNFRTAIKEISLSVEVYPLSLLSSRDKDPSVISPYFFAGIGSFNFNPETFYNKSWIELADMHTEGQGFAEYPERKPYKLTQINMPIGVGLHYEASPVVNFHFELMYRKLWTDYLDDVSKTYVDPALFIKYVPGFEAALAKNLADRRLTTDRNVIRKPGDIRGNDKNDDAYFSGAIRMVFILGRQKR